jgi:DNA invertase Pin-like site-specific DNA recombinase
MNGFSTLLGTAKNLQNSRAGPVKAFQSYALRHCHGTLMGQLTVRIDTSTPIGSFFFHVMGAIAEFERGLIRERTRAGIAAAKEAGRFAGRPRKTASPATIKSLVRPREEIFRELNISRSTLQRALRA